MRIWIAPLILFSVLSCSTIASAGEAPFRERFALADTAGREQLLQELVAGTEDYFYFQCLHYQNTKSPTELKNTLTRWRQSEHYDSAKFREIELREAIFSYPDDHQRSLDALTNHFGLEFDQQPYADGAGNAAVARPDLPTHLDPEEVSADAFLEALLEEKTPVVSLNQESAAWLIARGKPLPGQLSRRAVLSKIERPDLPGLVKFIEADLEDDKTGGFGSLEIHGKLLLPQLDELMDPSLLGNKHFVSAYLNKLRPSAMEMGTEDEILEAQLKRSWAFAEKLPPSMGAIQAYLLRQWLELDLMRGAIDKGRFFKYLQLPRKHDYVNPDLLKGSDFTFQKPADLEKQTGLGVIGADDESLVRDIFLTLFADEADYGRYTRYVRAEWLRPVFAEAQILAGKGDPEKLFSMIQPEAYRQLAERVDISVAQSNPKKIGIDEELKLAVDVKNVPKLIVKVFEINALNYFLEEKRDLDTSINLDGLVASTQSTHVYDEAPSRRVRREFEFPQLTGKRGAWVIEFVGNGKSSRALIRKGELHAIPRMTSAGQVFRVFDAERKPVAGARIWLDGHEFDADEKTGNILVPFSTNPRRAHFIVTDGEFALLDYFDHAAEKYELVAGLFVDRESLIAGNEAQLVIRPGLAINGEEASLGILQEATLSIVSINHDGVRSTERVTDVKLERVREFVHDFTVPERLSQLLVTLEAKVESLSTQRRIPVTVTQVFEVNKFDRTPSSAAMQLLKSGDDYLIEILGKNGEPQVDQVVGVELEHRFLSTKTVWLRSDKNGQIHLGGLEDIIHIDAHWGDGSDEGAMWFLPDPEVEGDYPSPINLANGETAQIPYESRSPALRRDEYSLLELRGETNIRDWFGALSLNGGILKVGPLPPGEYKLSGPGGWSMLSVTHDKPGSIPSGILVTRDRFLEHAPGKAPLAVKIAEPAGGEIAIRVTNASKNTRVHVVASRYLSPFEFFYQISDPISRGTQSVDIARANNSFISGRKIGDEYRYILERSDRPKYPGNMLPRPGLILNPYHMQDSISAELSADESGSGYGEGAAYLKRPKSDESHDGVYRQDSWANLDFLPEQRRTFYNLKPDKDGIVRMKTAELGSARFLRVAVVDGERGVWTSHALRAVERVEKRDRRLQKLAQLDPKGRFTRVREVGVLEKGEELTIGHANTAKYQIYDDLGDALSLLWTLGGVQHMEEFDFILDWPGFKEEDKRAWYSDYACHELNFFLSRRDPDFFSAVIEPYLRNKLEKDFMDHYLLGNDLSGYMDEWRLLRLNTAERALLARGLKGDAAGRTAKSIADLDEAQLANHVTRQMRFETALMGQVLSRSNEAAEFRRAMSSLEEDGQSTALKSRLKQIIIPTIDFTEATIEEAAEFLQGKSGIRILVEDSVGEFDQTINLQLSNVPLEDALKFSTELAGMKYRVRTHAVEIMPAWVGDDRLLTQTFRVAPDFLSRGGSDPGESGLRPPKSARGVLEGLGITFPDGGTATFIAATSELVVRTNQANMDLIQIFTDSLSESVSPPTVGSVVPMDDPFADVIDEENGDDLDPKSALGISPEKSESGEPMSPFDFGEGEEDPFSFSTNQGGAAGLRVKARQFYRKLDDTREWSETHYYKLPIAAQDALRVPVNAFWRDYAEWDGEGNFLSENFIDAHASFTDIILALAVLDLPFEAEPAKLKQKGNELTVTAGGASIVFVEQIRSAELADAGVVIGQKFYPLHQPTRFEGGVEVPNYIGGGFVAGTAYGSDIILTNPTGQHLEFEVLRQLPHGAIALQNSKVTEIGSVELAPYRTNISKVSFYFPMAGKFIQYPAQASRDGKVIATTAAYTFEVAAGLGKVDEESWDDIAARGSNEAVLRFLRTKNLNHYVLAKIAWRMGDQEFFSAAIEVLRERQIYHHELYSFGLAHDSPSTIRQYLLNSGRFLSSIGRVIDSELLTVNPTGRRLYQHLEYHPLVNARAHQLGSEQRIRNEQLKSQFTRLVGLLSRKNTPDDDDRLSIVYYLLLQNRVGEAIEFFDRIDSKKLATTIQYDYFRCYLAFYRETPEVARRVALSYKDYPVDRWRKQFAQVVTQADQIAGRANEAAIDDERDREQQQEKLAATSSSLELEIEKKTVLIRHKNTPEATLNLYKMDLEFLFSANPFVASDTTRFRFVTPNMTRKLELKDGGKGEKRVALPAEFQNENVLIEVVGGGKSKALAHFANDLDLTVTQNYGRLQLRHSGTGKGLPKAYIKVYARMAGGEVKFFKDGYTDLRGKFDYSSISADEPDILDVEKFAILVMHEEFGAEVKEVDPPNFRGR